MNFAGRCRPPGGTNRPGTSRLGTIIDTFRCLVVALRVDSVTDSALILRSLTATVGSWGAISVLGGSALAASGRSRTVAAFGQQTATWGAINVIIAGVGAWRSRRNTPDTGRLRTILLFNAMLDMGYVAVGVAIASGKLTFAGQITPETAMGHGTAVIVQGAALGAIDTAAAAALTLAGQPPAL